MSEKTPILPTNFRNHLKGETLFPRDRILLVLSILLQGAIALFFGHAYDMRIFMATGYLVGTGQNPYVAQNLVAVFQNSTFQGITSFGYPPPWALILGVIYLVTFRIIPNFLLYNLAIKIPLIIANIGMAFLVRHILVKLSVQESISRQAWVFLLFNPFLLLTTSAWGQFDSIVALLSLLSLYLLSQGKLTVPAILLALAIAFKPVALPLAPVVFVFLSGRSLKQKLQYYSVFSTSLLLFIVAPFMILGWEPTVILQHWNAHFTVGGGLSFMTFLENLNHSYQLTGGWWWVGWLWVPALVFATYALRPGITGTLDLFKKSLALILVFYLCRAWLSEPNVNLILPLVLILVSTGELKPFTLVAVWVLPLVFSFFNTSIAQLFFPRLPAVMEYLLKLAVEFNPVRFFLRTLVVIAWLVSGWWIVINCYKPGGLQKEGKLSN